ncbi:acetylornithine/succinyldiaminopimelate transaminase [Paraburkholderia terrae]|uniref:acetylornithine/succinyldiaminopimelate transaminase n=1 Tax=Paraburkholderia terrae TaxID=311230 RepID=UPI00296A9F0D|nr:acetylornithine/succinyldiaminopimelate transaminase [Paraburkholderia terrae]MDW3662267.1 acetylornithine/succinyldiaminopimelate transaminase [Paraburkholderia terrae]
MTRQPIVNRTTFDSVMVPTYSPASIIPVRAEGSRVWDSDGIDYVDLAGGIAVTALGHGHPAVVDTLVAQANRLWHISNVFTNEPSLQLASRLTEATFASRAFFANSGAEANEAALKLARRVAFNRYRDNPDKVEVLSFAQSFHGRTLFTVSVGGQPKYATGFGPLPQAIKHLRYNDIEDVTVSIGPNTCAVIVEPVQGEGGVYPANREFLLTLRRLCDKHDALLIFDEVQIGVGRSGSLYAYMAYGVTPDVLTTAKSLGNGFPIAAMLTTDELAAHFSPGTHGSTYGGNPLGAAVADKVVELVNVPTVLNGVRERSAHILAALRGINGRHGIFRELRGMGLLLGAELSDDFAGRAPDFVGAALSAGVMILNAGQNVLRLAPSLIIPFEDIDEGLRRFEGAIPSVIDSEVTV